MTAPAQPETWEHAEIRRLTRLAKSSGVISNLALASRYHAQISRLREQIKQSGATR